MAQLCRCSKTKALFKSRWRARPVRAAIRAAATSALKRLFGLRIELTEYYQCAATNADLP
jgi:hypothetical protein